MKVMEAKARKTERMHPELQWFYLPRNLASHSRNPSRWQPKEGSYAAFVVRLSDLLRNPHGKVLVTTRVRLQTKHGRESVLHEAHSHGHSTTEYRTCPEPLRKRGYVRKDMPLCLDRSWLREPRCTEPPGSDLAKALGW